MKKAEFEEVLTKLATKFKFNFEEIVNHKYVSKDCSSYVKEYTNVRHIFLLPTNANSSIKLQLNTIRNVMDHINIK